jgi:integrase
MAWAERLKSGKYRGLYRDAHGVRRSAGTYAHKSRARNAAAAKEENARRSMLRDPEAFRRPWGEWVEEWWPARKVEVSTAKVDRGRLDRHLMPRWGEVPIGSITRHDVKAWTSQMERDGIGPTTIQRCTHLLSASMTAAMDAEIVESNPAARLKLAGSAKAQERYLSREEYEAVLEQLPTTADQLIVKFATNTGMRPGEWAGVHWNRVDLERGTVRVVETFSELGGLIKAYPKSRKIREVPLTDELVDLLREERTGRDDLTAGCGVRHAVGECRSSLVLRTHGGSVVRNSNWSPVWRGAVKAAGIEPARLYDMRHTFASWLLASGEYSLAEVGVLMGHSSAQTTLIYAHLAPTSTDRFRAALAPAAPRKSHEGAKVIPIHA